MNYLKIALRIQTHYKWFALINVAGLSLGVMCSLIIFLYVNSHLNTDTHHPHADRIYRLVLNIQTPDGGVEYDEGSALPVGKALHEEFSQVEKTSFCMRFYNTPTISILTPGKNEKFKEDNIAAYADNNFIEMFDHHFISGDKYTALKNPKSVVLSEKQAVKYFGSADVLGRSININNSTDLIITGVFETSSGNSDLKFEVLVSLPTLKVLNPKYQDQNFSWSGSNNWTFVKLKAGVPATALEEQLPSFVKKHLGADFNHWNFHLQPLADMHYDLRYDGVINKVILWVLGGVAAALICIVCINYVNLAMAQSNHRAREIGVRKYLGGSKRELFLQFITETSLLVVLSIGLATAGSYQILPFINTWLQVDLSLMQFAAPDKFALILFFTVGLTLLAGYYPAVILAGYDPIKAMTGKVGTVKGGNNIFRKSLICFQYAIAILFLISTFTIISQVDFLLKNDLGFSKDSHITLTIPRSDYSKLRTFRDEVANITGVESVSLHHEPPMSVTMDGGFIKYDNRAHFEEFMVRDRWADDQFVDTYSLQIMAGRNIILNDSLTEVIVNETLLEKLNIRTPDEALGKSVLFDNSAITGIIVGVVRDFHHRSLQNDIEPVAIYPFYGVFNQAGVRFHSENRAQALAGVESLWKTSFPDDVLKISFLDDSISRMYQVEQITKKLMSVFAVVSVVICCIGILGLSAFSALQRMKEIGIRKVLGADTFTIIIMLCKQYLTLIMLAFAVAIPVTYLLMQQWLETFAYHVSLNWLSFAMPGFLMVVVTLLLVSAQSLRAALRNPAEVLKHE